MNTQLVYRVQLNEQQFDDLKFYTGVNNADNFIASREDSIKNLYVFMTNNELEYLKVNKSIDYVIFCKD